MVTCAIPYLENELNDIVRLFHVEHADIFCEVTFDSTNLVVCTTIAGQLGEGIKERNEGVDGFSYRRDFSFVMPETLLEQKRIIKRYAKTALYRALQNLTGKTFPYGGLTGIRPAKLLRQIRAEGHENIDSYFTSFLGVAPEKLALIKAVDETQQGHLTGGNRVTDVYIGIPFCRGRCSYCSFVSCDIDQCKQLEIPYVDALLQEMKNTTDLIEKRALKVRSLYIGGGTPSALSIASIERILKAVQNIRIGNIDGLTRQMGEDERMPYMEFTFEAGRPDSITRELLDLLNKYGVTRISVNPQTLKDETLREIGRHHTTADYYRAFALARTYPFEINTDLIMGLPNESFSDFCASLIGVMELWPEDITVHTLSLKSGSRLKEEVERLESGELERMSQFAFTALSQHGYRPYYIYRQKYMAGNLENTGYTRGAVCVYNIDNMEEVCSVLALGANGISKRVYESQGRIERYASPKDIATYIGKIEEINIGKCKLFSEEN